ncbi:MAG: GspE/PulE family protein [Halothermotrichaceae bacterium]
MANRNIKRLGELLKDFNYISEEQLAEVRQKIHKTNKSFQEVLIESGYITEEELIETMQVQLDVPRANISEHEFGPDLAQYIPENIAHVYCVVPLEKDNDILKVAMVDPGDLIAIDLLRSISKLKIKPYIASRKSIKRAQGLVYTIMGQAAENVFDGLAEYQQESEPEIDELKKMVDEAPIVKLANIIITQAIQMRASDIHIEPREEQIIVRYRIDGVLRDNMIAPKYSQAALISRIKIMADLDITNRKTPQDGRVKLNFNGLEVDMRVSTLPTIYGESVVIRLLNKDDNLLNINKLGFNDYNLQTFKKIIHNPYGIILVTGPTGSGKSTTLFAVLNEIRSKEKKLITIEDPVEYRLQGISQVQVNTRAGRSFGTVLRSILRQDPDIIMVGEIRDEETAQIAVRAALTGHLVLSTLHTNDSVSSISRLIDMGVPPYLLAATLRGIIAQRLLRRLCNNCKQKFIPDADVREYLNLEKGKTIYKEKGCNKCGSIGYKGRIAVQEVLTVDSSLEKLIANNASEQQIKTRAVEQGLVTLEKDAAIKVKSGITSYKEMFNIVV